MNVENQLRALGTRLENAQGPITIDDIPRRHVPSGTDGVRLDGAPTGTPRRDGIARHTNHETRIVMLSPDREQQQPSRSRLWLALAAAAVVLVVVAGLVVATRPDDDPSPTQATVPPPTTPQTEPEPDAQASPGPAEVLEEYRVAFNAGDIDAVMALFSEDSTITDHPLAAGDLVGLERIWAVHVSDIGMAADVDAYEFSNVEASGDTVTFDHRWTNEDGAVYCGEGHRLTIRDGTILTWNFGTSERCE